MFRLVLAAGFGLVIAGTTSAQCGNWYRPYPGPVYVPIYPLGTSVWGAPAPLPLPPAPKPFVPKAGVGVKEEVEPSTPKTSDVPKDKKSSESKEKETPKIPKPKLPIPVDPDEKPAKPPKFETPMKDLPADKTKAVEQFIVPAEENSKPSAEVRVGFFNHSDREITLDVNGEPVKLPSEQYVTVRVSRTFTWSEKGQKSTDVVVPPDAEGVEIVFRK
jgi:hypothetical protein